jgi:hypothetical protein
MKVDPPVYTFRTFPKKRVFLSTGFLRHLHDLSLDKNYHLTNRNLSCMSLKVESRRWPQNQALFYSNVVMYD